MPSAITMNGGTLLGTGTSSITLSGNVTATSAAGSSASIATNIALTGTRSFTVNPGGTTPDLIVNGVVSDGGGVFGLTKLGAGTMNLTALSGNTYTGTTTVTSGVLQLKQDSGRTIQGPLVIGNNVDPAGTATVRELIQSDLLNTISVTLNKSGVLDMNGFNDTIDALTGTGKLLLPTVGVSKSRLSIGNANSSFTFAGEVSGTDGIFQKVGTGTVSFTGKLSSVLGQLSVADGTLGLNTTVDSLFPTILQVGDGVGAAGSAVARMDGPDKLGPSSTVNIKADGTLNLNGKTATTGTLSIEGGSVAMISPAALVVANQLTMNSGSLTGTGLLTLVGNVTATSGATSATIGTPVALNGIRTFTVNPGSTQPELVTTEIVSNGNSGPGGVFKSGNGTMRFSPSSNTYTGLTTVDRGTLELNATNSVAIAGGLIVGNDVDAANSAVVKNLVIFNISANAEVTVKGSGKLDLNGFSDRAFGLSGSGSVTLGTATLNIFHGANSTFTGLISGTGGVIKAGAGTQTFTQNNTYSGATNISAGKMVINGTQTGNFSVSAGATLGGTGLIGPTVTASASGSRVAPGSGSDTGALRVGGSINLSNGKLIVRLNDSGTLKSDKLSVTNNLNITGATLLPIPLGPVSATPHVIATYGPAGLTGTFASVPAGCTVNYAYNDGVSSNNIAITISNNWQTWLTAYELNPATTGLPDADPDNDGIANGLEFVLGLDPTVANNPTDLPDASVSGSNFLFRFRRAGAASAYNFIVQTSPSLAGPASWTNAVSGFTVEPSFFGPGVDRVTYTTSIVNKPRLFARLRIDGL